MVLRQSNIFGTGRRKYVSNLGLGNRWLQALPDVIREQVDFRWPLDSDLEGERYVTRKDPSKLLSA